ncbi:MAG TPA: hypothetical protein PKA64_22920, partial [Myxococcota bacterium]|nr:hypothetical protein [Myxococcota bacterium]
MLPWLAVAAFAADHEVVAADLFTIDAPAGLAVDAAGTRVAWIRQRWDRDLDRTARDLWTLDTRTRAATRLTFTEGDEGHPTFSPDDAWIYFDAPDDAGKRQVRRVPAAGGAAQDASPAHAIAPAHRQRVEARDRVLGQPVEALEHAEPALGREPAEHHPVEVEGEPELGPVGGDERRHCCRRIAVGGDGAGHRLGQAQRHRQR